MFTSSQDTGITTTENVPAPFVPARVYLSHDGRSLLHILADGRMVCRPVADYREQLARGRGDSALVAARRFFASPAAKVAQAIVLWLLKLLLLTWLALHPGMHLPVTEVPTALEAPAE